MTHLDAEQALEDRTMRLFANLGWATANAYYEAFDPQAATPSHPYLGRANETQVLLLPRLRAALEKLNPLPPAALDAALAELARGRSVVTSVQANHDVHQLLKDGVPVTYRDDHGQECQERVRVIDWNDPANNDFLMVQQLWISGEGRRRPDLVGFVNGIPLLFCSESNIMGLEGPNRSPESNIMGLEGRDSKTSSPPDQR
ncbi:MAG: type I restriction endonuclease subunit R [Chloroflexi bacterium]|nr:type I restriction endonuclease subunit R [Chloroflexota bacterium]